MKREGFFVLLVALFCFSIILVSATPKYISHDIIRSYVGGEKISGVMNISFRNDEAHSLFTSNFLGNISLIDLIRANDFVEGSDYNCTTQNCAIVYNVKSAVSNVNVNGEKFLGIKITGDDITEVKKAKFDVSSSSGASCEQQLVIDVTGSGERNMTNIKYTDVACGSKNYGCFSSDLPSYSQFTITNNAYCENISLPVGPAYKIGAKIKNSTNGKTNQLKMQLYDEDVFLGECNLANLQTQEGDVECIVNYSSSQARKYRACILSPSFIDESTSADYTIRTESSGLKCGTDDSGGTWKRDYEIFGRSMQFDSFSMSINDTTYLNQFGDTLSNIIQNYISDVYANQCDPSCVVPIKLIGNNQNVIISNPEFSYKIGQSLPAPEKNIYDVEKKDSKVNSGFLQVKLDQANFTIPLTSEASKFTLYFDGDNLFSSNIQVTPSFNFDLNSKFALVGINTFFRVNLVDVNSSVWNFGDNKTIVTASGNNVTHLYDKSGTYQLEVSLVKNNGESAKKKFDILVGQANESASILISKYNSRIENITLDINLFSPIISNEIKKKINPIDLSAQLSKLKNDYSVASSDEDYVRIVDGLLNMDVPYKIAAIKTGDGPLQALSKNVDLSYIESLSGNVDSNLDESKLKDDINIWNNDNYNSRLSFKQIYSIKDSGKEALLTNVKISFVPKQDQTNKPYFIINYPLEEIKFSIDYGQKSIDSGTQVELTGQSQDIEFTIAQSVEMEDLGMYLSPEIRNLNGDYENIEAIEKPYFKTFWFSVGIAIILLVTFIIYIVLQEWYKNHYESHLFKNGDELYNIINFIYNSRVSNIVDSEIKKKLSKSGWNYEQISYAFRKIDGKRTGMFEIPIFKHKENKKVFDELTRRQQKEVDVRFIKRPSY